MMIGIISDTHDNLDAIDEAIGIFNERGVDLVAHAGDVISPFSAARFKGLKAPMRVVFGNNDGERRGLRIQFKDLDSEIDDFSDFDIDRKKVALYHGTIEGVLKALLDSEKYDVVVSGHSHSPEVKWQGKTLSINPGEACGYLSSIRTLCILDIGSMKPEIVEF
jgi:putative phosphoesterase